MCGALGADRNYAPIYSSIHQANGRIRYKRGGRLPVIPKRAQPAIRVNGEIARVEVLQLHREPLQSINEADAIAEGVGSIDEYRELWQSINGKTKGARWQDNPYVTVIGFTRTAELLAALEAEKAAP